MRLVELFEEPIFEKNSQYVKDLESYIIDLVVNMQAQVGSVYLSQIEGELQHEQYSIDSKFLKEFITTLEAVDRIDDETGEIIFASGAEDRKDKHEQDKQKAQINRGAMNAIKKKDKKPTGLEL